LPVPALLATLGCLDAYRSAWLRTKLTAAESDHAAEHTDEPVDAAAAAHNEWEKK
jgi:6-phosphogluconate dehydrogenase